MANIKSRPKTRLDKLTKSWQGIVFRNITFSNKELDGIQEIERLLAVDSNTDERPDG